MASNVRRLNNARLRLSGKAFAATKYTKPRKAAAKNYKRSRLRQRDLAVKVSNAELVRT